ncbi:MAG TPA: transcriptional regulator [Terracidiphilus sp.]|nr:transcriptional regulator [Terracidiphilus sp.]
MVSSASADAAVFGELWVSLASLLRSYTAAHGLNRTQQATVELGENRITVRHGGQWLDLRRNIARVDWMRENGLSGVLELTEHGRLRSAAGEEELDMAAEAWARQLMQGAREQ